MSAARKIKYCMRLLREKFLLFVNFIKSKLKVGSYWYWIEGGEIDEEIKIKDLVYPHRYDILIRKNFFEKYKKNRLIYKNDSEKLIKDSLSSEYFLWFKYVVLARYRPDLLSDASAVEEAFERRVSSSVSLFESILEGGFNQRFPIIPYTAETILPVSDSCVESEKYFMGDGCHRLACLMLLGYERIPKKMVKIKCFRQYRPFNNTAILAQYIKEAKSWNKIKRVR